MRLDATDAASLDALEGALSRRGWTPLVYQGSWSGVATRPPLVAVCNVLPGDDVLDLAGRGSPWPGLLGVALCPFCSGTTRLGQVSNCDECAHGLTYRSTWTSYPQPWPSFGPNPAGKTWHVEQAGRVIGAGRGLRQLGRIVTPQVRLMRADQLATRIEHAGGLCDCPACAGAGTLAVGRVCLSCFGGGRQVRARA